MKSSHQLALIVAYYLSRGDKQAYTNLGYSSFADAVKGISEILGVKVNTVKNMRDEFDPYHDNDRVGWLRELRGSRLKVLKSFQETDDGTLLEIVKGILFDKSFQNSEEYQDIENLFAENKQDTARADTVIVRGPTGKKAEMFFMEFFERNGKPVAGTLIDKRDHACGYDFEIVSGDELFFIEVKGLSANSGGVLFTNKEWQTAINVRDRYFLTIVRNLSDTPKIEFIRDPARRLKAKKNIYTTVQLNWSVTDKELSQIDPLVVETDLTAQTS